MPSLRDMSRVDLQDGNGPQRLRGVSFDTLYRQWATHITVDGLRMFGGYHPDPVSAAKAYDSLARTYHGAKALTNFPEGVSDE
ncbi:hypothetical protein V5F77_20630 [Xanthobacter sp. DSM 24535]|uniref:hypothetical protein n=1 Tax=Roseixanthobacter psychrophilus TaxID=3119917 RepID=UPI003728AF22